MLDRNWLKLYEAAILEINPDKLAICIGAAEQAIAQRESLLNITELERRKLADARSMLKSLSRIASSQGKRAALVQTPSQQAAQIMVRLFSSCCFAPEFWRSLRLWKRGKG